MLFAVFVQPEQEKCAKYWPSKEERDMDFIDTGFTVTLVSEDAKPNYTIRLLELLNGKVNVILNDYIIKCFSKQDMLFEFCPVFIDRRNQRDLPF